MGKTGKLSNAWDTVLSTVAQYPMPNLQFFSKSDIGLYIPSVMRMKGIPRWVVGIDDISQGLSLNPECGSGIDRIMFMQRGFPI